MELIYDYLENICPLWIEYMNQFVGFAVRLLETFIIFQEREVKELLNMIVSLSNALGEGWKICEKEM